MTRATIELISQKFFVCKAQELSMRVERERERERNEFGIRVVLRKWYTKMRDSLFFIYNLSVPEIAT